jgi:putative addiction module antidote
MALRIKKIGDSRVVELPPELLAQLGWDTGDVLVAEVIEGGIKFTRAKTKHDRAMEIAREVMEKYRQTFEALAKS